KNNNDYEHKNIKEILNMFQQSVLEFDYIEETTGKLKTFGSGLINTYELDHTDQIYTIMMHEVLYNHITDFVKMQKKKNGYTAINLSVLFNFRGAYTQRLYTLFRLWSRENKEVEIKYKLDELRFYLKLKDNVYPEYKYFKQNVLKRAMNEINKKGNMVVSIKEEKRKNRK
ncbi:RepB family plasmid replication initiator protein, partial [Clostridioides difficile]